MSARRLAGFGSRFDDLDGSRVLVACARFCAAVHLEVCPSTGLSYRMVCVLLSLTKEFVSFVGGGLFFFFFFFLPLVCCFQTTYSQSLYSRESTIRLLYQRKESSIVIDYSARTRKFPTLASSVTLSSSVVVSPS